MGANDLLAVMQDTTSPFLTWKLYLDFAILNEKISLMRLLKHHVANIVVTDVPDISETPAYNNDPILETKAAAAFKYFHSQWKAMIKTLKEDYPKQINDFELSSVVKQTLNDLGKRGMNIKEGASDISFYESFLKDVILQPKLNPGVTLDTVNNYFFVNTVHPTEIPSKVIGMQLAHFITNKIKQNGNYEAFAQPKPAQEIEDKKAFLVGAGFASLAADTFLIRDAKMNPENIHIFEELSIAGGSLDGILNPDKGFISRGGREMENHFECLWDLFRSIPSLEIEGASVLDEFYWLNKEDTNYSKCRLIHQQRKRTEDDGKFTLNEEACKKIIELFLTKEVNLSNKTIEEVFPEDFFKSNFWWYWSSMFAFEKWHSAMEMRRYIMRFIHHLGGLPDLSALKFTKYNQYESLVLPLISHLEEQGVVFHYETIVKKIIISENENKEKIAKKIIFQKKNKEQQIIFKENDFVFVTNGSITESTTYGDHNTPAPISEQLQLGGSWELWENFFNFHKKSWYYF